MCFNLSGLVGKRNNFIYLLECHWNGICRCNPSGTSDSEIPIGAPSSPEVPASVRSILVAACRSGSASCARFF